MALLLSACAAPTQPASPPTAAPTTQPPTGPPPAGLQLAHLQQAAYNYARYHELVLRQVYPEREVEGLRTGSPTTSWAVRLSLRPELRPGGAHDEASSVWPRCVRRWTSL